MTEEPLRSLHTNTFPALLDELGISLLITTYQAGKLVALRADGGVLNTHFRSFAKPIVLALRGPQLAIGIQHEIWEYHANDAVAPKMEPLGNCDGCFMPRVGHVTGDMQIHEMEWVDEELWFVNTLFSCLVVPGHSLAGPGQSRHETAGWIVRVARRRPFSGARGISD